ncbi:hypothetical protein D3C75_972030 [compost metagenome]
MVSARKVETNLRPAKSGRLIVNASIEALSNPNKVPTTVRKADILKPVISPEKVNIFK